LIKYIKSFLWRIAKRLSYIEEARCLKVKQQETEISISQTDTLVKSVSNKLLYFQTLI